MVKGVNKPAGIDNGTLDLLKSLVAAKLRPGGVIFYLLDHLSHCPDTYSSGPVMKTPVMGCD